MENKHSPDTPGNGIFKDQDTVPNKIFTQTIIDGTREILRNDPDEALKCDHSDSLVIRQVSGWGYSIDETYQVNIKKPRNNPNLS